MRNEAVYGYPLSSIFIRIVVLIFLFLIIAYIGLFYSFIIFFLSCISIPVVLYVFIVRFRIKFSVVRKEIIDLMIEKADLNGCEIILDIGTGAGYAAINFARKLSTGSVIGIDKYDLKNQGIFQRFLNELKINFFGNSLNNAKKNSQIEGVENKISFIKADLIQPFPFSSNYFDLIISSQFLYCISHNKLTQVLIEIDRVLSDKGKLVFFESNKFMFWDIYHLKDFFTDKGYNVRITPLDSLSNKSIFIAQKKNK